MWVFVGTMTVLLTPKLLGFLMLLGDGRARRGFGGALRAFLGILLETIVGGLIAPVTMLVQSGAVVSILLGRDGGWRPQRRGDGHIPLGDTARRYAGHTVFGLALGLASYLVAPSLLLWMSPVVLGLSLAVPLAVLTAEPRLGRTFRQAGLLQTPEERQPPEVLSRARALGGKLASDETAAEMPIPRLLLDPILLDAHRHMLPPPRLPGRDPIDATLLVGVAKLEEAADLHAALATLTTAEKAAVLADPHGLDCLERLAKSSPEERHRSAIADASGGVSSS
jgi:membrane glycosyltransferase